MNKMKGSGFCTKALNFATIAVRDPSSGTQSCGHTVFRHFEQTKLSKLSNSARISSTTKIFWVQTCLGLNLSIDQAYASSSFAAASVETVGYVGGEDDSKVVA